MNKWLWFEFILCVIFPILFAPLDFFVLHGSLLGALYGLGLIPVFIFDYIEERRKANTEL